MSKTPVEPPHPNAEAHERFMKKLSRMSDEQIVQSSVKAGIHTADGRLTDRYAQPSPATSRPSQQPARRQRAR